MAGKTARKINPQRAAAFARRRLLFSLAVLCALTTPSWAQQDNSVVVMTSYPDNVVSRFEAAFEEANPDIDMQVLWRASGDAMNWLTQDGHAPVDVYWTPSPRSFTRLKAEGKLEQLSPDQRALPATLGATQISDPEGYFVASEVAGYGFAINRASLTEKNLALPTDWSDLVKAEYAGMIGLPVPSAVGYAPVMVDIVLQAYGWDEGWRVWSEIVGNAQLIRQGSTLVSDEVATQRIAIGLSIDFFVASGIANGAAIEFVYPEHGGLNPAHVAILSEGTNRDEANTFVDFILSARGQSLLGHPDIRKLPVRPDVYSSLPAGFHNPFASAAKGGYDYDNDLGQKRILVLTAVFEQMLITSNPEHVRLWQAIHTAEHNGADMSEARILLSQPLISAQRAADPALQKLFATRADEMGIGGRDNSQAAVYEQNWKNEIEARHAAVARLLEAHSK